MKTRWVALSFCLMGLGIASAGPDENEEVGLTERVLVTATRLADETVQVEDVPAHVTVISRQQIEDSGARTLQDLLAREAGVVLYDEVGNDIQKKLDLRGFTEGTGTRVFVDGAPFNDSRNNTLHLELIPLSAIERIEIVRGSAAALAGGGSEAGVIQLFTRRGETSGGALAAAAGSFDSNRFEGEWHQDLGRFDLFLTGSREATDGFRQNADAELRRVTGALGLDLGQERRLELSVLDGRGELGNPGALTRDEFDDDPHQAPRFNAPDFSDERVSQASVNYRGPLSSVLSFAANLFLRDRADEILSTGRAAPEFGGFFLDSDERTYGSTLQLTHDKRSARRENLLSIGLEWLEGETESKGFSTQPGLGDQFDPAMPDSDNTIERRTGALFLQDSWSLSSAWQLSAGVRFDRDRVGYRQRLPTPPLRDFRTFSEESLRAGASWNPAERFGFYASYSEGFLPPTIEQLFAFPGFFSNPDLEPQVSRSYEIGLRADWTLRHHANLALFLMDTADEIIFDPNFDLDPDDGMPGFGANVNAGKTRRAGLEASYRGQLTGRLDLLASVTAMDAEFRNGSNRGQDVPLVPVQRAALGCTWHLPAGLALRADGLYVGEQVLDNDNANEQERLDAYTVVDSRLSWSLTAGRKPDTGWELFAEAKNLFDRTYATRGIYAFNFFSDVNEVFLTPAPGRRFLVGAEWGF